MEFIWKAVQTYGPSIAIIAAIIIVFVGILKLCKLFDKIKSKDLKKGLFLLIDVVLAFVGAAVYFAIFKIAFTGYYVLYSVTLFGTTAMLYTIYEGAHLRKGVRLLFKLIAGWFKKNPEAKLTKTAEKYGLVDAINFLQAKQEEQAKAEAAKAAAEVQPVETAPAATTDTTVVKQ